MELNDMVGRIEAHKLAQSHEGWFVTRLARDQGWTPEHAARVVGEYQRFIALAASTDDLTPSAAVDKAWHQHILDTRAYAEFCQNALGRSFLHHRPGRGSAQEREQFAKQYARTLELYRSTFGQEPPADIWPPADGGSKLSLAAARGVYNRYGAHAGTVWILAAIALMLSGCTSTGGSCSSGGFVVAVVIGAVLYMMTGGGGGSGQSSCGCGGD